MLLLVRLDGLERLATLVLLHHHVWGACVFIALQLRLKISSKVSLHPLVWRCSLNDRGRVQGILRLRWGVILNLIMADDRDAFNKLTLVDVLIDIWIIICAALLDSKLGNRWIISRAVQWISILLGEVQQFGLRLSRDCRQLHAVLPEIGLSLACHVNIHLCALHLDRIVDSG